MTLDQIYEEWGKDCGIDPSDMKKEFISQSYMTHKYLKYKSMAVLRMTQTKSEMAILKRQLEDYFLCKLDLDELKELDLKPYQGRVLKTEVKDYIEAHPLYIKLIQKYAYHKEMVDALEEIIKQVSSRDVRLGRIQRQIFFDNGMTNV